ncbi:MAG: two-component system response regulator [Ignavibacteriales bacterium CG_4_9_14_3_um_filter_34_10]|nr:MAG: two-component system response regulator [Ignavibacteriales bacterium CG_4_9_14_3_um_filter_34_10]
MELKFLIVDDSLTMRRIVTNSLKNLGYNNFVEAADGKEALEKLAADSAINFVITDWNMPVLSGLELVKAIRGDAKLATMPILMVTTRGVKEDILQALQARVNNYVVKPFTPQVLNDKIQQVLATT